MQEFRREYPRQAFSPTVASIITTKGIKIMGMFSNLMSKFFGQANASPAPTTPASSPGVLASSAPAAGASAPVAASPAAASSAAAPPAAPVDVTAILDGLAAKNSEKLDWKKSIVDLLKLVGMDSSLAARKELATDLAYSGDQSDSATMNVWLHKEVLKKLAANGGKVPAELLD